MLPNNTISAVIVLNKNNFGSVGYSAIRDYLYKNQKEPQIHNAFFKAIGILKHASSFITPWFM